MATVIDGTTGITQLKGAGTTTNDNAAAGQVGEFKEQNLNYSAASGISSNVVVNILSLTLDAGDWDVEGMVGFNPAASTSITQLIGGLSLTSATLDYTCAWVRPMPAYVPGAANLIAHATPRKRISVAVPTVVYLVAYSLFTVNTLSAYGRISARRVR